MRVAFVHPNAPHADGTGATHSATRIVEELEGLGYTVVPYCLSEPPDDDGRTYERLEASGFPYHTATNLNDALVARTDEFEQFDVVHSYLTPSVPAMDHITRETSAATVVTLNAYAGVCPKNDLQFFDERACTDNSLHRCVPCTAATSAGHPEHGRLYTTVSRWGNLRNIKRISPDSVAVDGFHALAPHVRETYAGFGYPDDRIDVIPNILDEKFLVDHRSDFSEPYRLLYVGELSRKKGVDRFPEVLERLQATGRTYTLTIVGDGGLRPELSRRLSDRNLGGLVEFRGRVPNDQLPDVYASHDAFVYPGRWEEPFGRVFLEAMAAGTPVVATDIGSVDRIVGGGGRVADGEGSALAATLSAIIDSEALPTLSASAKEKVREYRGDVVVGGFENLYRRVC